MGSHSSRPAADAREALESLRRLVRALRESAARAHSGAGLSGAQLFALQQFAGDAALSVGELAERTLTHQSSVSVVARRLVEGGLLARHAAAGDKRRVELRLTASGKAVLRRAPATAQARLATALLRLPPAARGGLLRGLRLLEREMGLAGGSPGMFFEHEQGRRRG
jgi:DNA-binding MarR family transcriptional regulator